MPVHTSGRVCGGKRAEGRGVAERREVQIRGIWVLSPSVVSSVATSWRSFSSVCVGRCLAANGWLSLRQGRKRRPRETCHRLGGLVGETSWKRSRCNSASEHAKHANRGVARKKINREDQQRRTGKKFAPFRRKLSVVVAHPEFLLIPPLRPTQAHHCYQLLGLKLGSFISGFYFIIFCSPPCEIHTWPVLSLSSCSSRTTRLTFISVSLSLIPSSGICLD